MGKQWCKNFVSFYAVLMMLFGGVTVLFDPYFHYHKPLKGFAYKIHNERYQNDGITKHFDYDALIIGTSMTENFKTSEMDKLFGTRAIKVPYSGAKYKELRESLERAIKANPKLKTIIWGLDYDCFGDDFNAMKYKSYPTYLYDDCLFNDVNYFFNKSILIKETYMNVIDYTRKGGNTTNFDEYKNWNAAYKFGKDTVLKRFNRPPQTEKAPIGHLNPENIEKNVLCLVRAHPEIEFYLFWPPFGIVWFDMLQRKGILENTLTWEKEALELMLPYKNVHFFSFFDEFSIIANLDNYKDIAHYHQDINSYILKCMANGQHQLTMENYESYCKKEWDFYTTYDYDAIYK